MQPVFGVGRRSVVLATLDNVSVSTIEKFDPKNMGVAAGILFLSALELERYTWGEILPPWTLNVSILCWTPGGLTVGTLKK
jgi:hypothetical protein